MREKSLAKPTLILGIETSCDETAAALVEVNGGLTRPKFRIISNVVSSQVKLHAPYGGVVPNLAAREHVKNLPYVVRLVFKEAMARRKKYGIKEKKSIYPIPYALHPDLIAVTIGPGLIPSLLIGTNFARALAWTLKKPIVGVNHLEGHIYSNWLAPIREAPSSKHQTSNKYKNRTITFPATCLIVSGGHTELILMKGHGQYQLLGETRDDAAGEAFDKVARILDLGFPGGPIIDKLARSGNPNAFSLPRPMIATKNFDFSFSGLKTAVLYLTNDLRDKGELKSALKDVCASFQAAVVEVLIKKTSKASREFRARQILVSGGVSANSRLRQAFREEKSIPLPVFFPPAELTTDNAAMIAMAGYIKAQREASNFSWKKISADANLRLAG